MVKKSSSKKEGKEMTKEIKNIEKVEKVHVDHGRIIIKIKFISEQFENNDESTITKNVDQWSFEKPIKSKNPNWLLGST